MGFFGTINRIFQDYYEILKQFLGIVFDFKDF